MGLFHFLVAFLCIIATGFGSAQRLRNAEAVVPPQCYTKTEGQYNPCYVCHQTHLNGERRNGMLDGGLQAAYAFSDVGTTNQWTNLFQLPPKTPLSDADISNYIRENNVSALRQTVSSQDFYQLDLAGLSNPDEAFFGNGLARDGSAWVAYNYKPFPSTFWPTNGSYGDAMIRLPAKFRESEALYFLNLAVVEMAIKGLKTIEIKGFDESSLNRDIDGDGKIAIAHHLVIPTDYFGAASDERVRPLQYPVGTEFLHTVRYVDVDSSGNSFPSARLKELRYSKKYKYLSDAALRFAYNQEHREKALEKLPRYSWALPVTKAGINNKFGWFIQGWIEDANGELRLQNYEENFFCMGCHTSTGTTIDSTFSFPRKVTGSRGWGYINLKGMVDAPNYGEEQGEILTYLMRVGGGDEFRQNHEMKKKWFSINGNVDLHAVKTADVHQLITPSPARAMALNRAYLSVVKEQQFIRGRDGVLAPVSNVYKQVGEDAPTLPPEKQFTYDLRLNWQ